MKIAQEYNCFSSSPIISPKEIIARIHRLPIPYIGNKKKLIISIHNTMLKHRIEFTSIADAFSGSGVVSHFFRLLGKRVLSNDILYSSFLNSLVLTEMFNVRLTDGEIDFILNNDSPLAVYNNKRVGPNLHFVRDNYLCVSDREDKTNGRYGKFTKYECEFLDRFSSNCAVLSSPFKIPLAFISLAAVVMRLPFGQVDMSEDVLMHRKKQIAEYGKNSGKPDRRIGIYYDENLQLNFHKWFRKYHNDFATAISDIKMGKLISEAFNMDVIDFLDQIEPVDCIYFDPPYGGQSSDYSSLYRFFEEFSNGKPLEQIEILNKGAYRFIGSAGYEKNFIEMLEAAKKIPIWIFSYNDRAWNGIEFICELIKRCKKDVVVETINGSYKYVYREKVGKGQKGIEYLIIAR